MQNSPDVLAALIADDLTPELGAEIRTEVTRLLGAGDTSSASRDPATAVGIASLIVAIAQLAVGLYMTRPKGDGGKARIEIANELGARLQPHYFCR